jgi:hypothetical protein
MKNLLLQTTQELCPNQQEIYNKVHIQHLHHNYVLAKSVTLMQSKLK